jgi:GNAT superfamily N-acetyltransferase
LHRRSRDRRPLLCDEFGAVLHRRLAKAIAFNLRKLVTRERLALVVATSHEDLEEDLQPDTVVRLGGNGPVIERRMISDLRLQISEESRLEIADWRLKISDGSARLRLAAKQTHRKMQPHVRMQPAAEQPAAQQPAAQKPTAQRPAAERPAARRPAAERMASFMRGLRIEPGTVRDYQQFAGMHYRRRDQLGFVDKVVVAREVSGGELVGIVVYGMPVLQLRLRNRVTGGRFVRSVRRLNRELRVLKRLVIHPDVRGCGLGHWLVRRTLPMVGARFVECLAAMGAVHPVFDKAGMRRIGTVEPPAEQGQALSRLLAAGADPLAADFVTQVCRRPSVRRIVSEAVFNWYQTTTGGGERRVERQTPVFLAHTYRQLAGSQPVYFIWAADEKGRQIINENTEDYKDGITDVA